MKQKSYKITVYTDLKMKKAIEKLKFEIWNSNECKVSVSELFRIAIDDLLKNHRKELINGCVKNEHE